MYSPKTDGEPVLVEPVRMDEDGRLVFGSRPPARRSDREGQNGSSRKNSIWRRDPELSYVMYSPKTDGEPVLVEPVRMDEDGRLVFGSRPPARRSDREGQNGSSRKNSIWRRDPELSYVMYSPKTDGEPVLVEPVRMDRNGRPIVKKKEPETESEQESRVVRRSSPMFDNRTSLSQRMMCGCRERQVLACLRRMRDAVRISSVGV